MPLWMKDVYELVLCNGCKLRDTYVFTCVSPKGEKIYCAESSLWSRSKPWTSIGQKIPLLDFLLEGKR
ncbi:hypothetical protein LCGC14_1167470 [marine sediment metagenome]|uniref:Uncharacterized protein n=1 Tax=marine sediment metagenome TaxID=412755 RepID=A0A0F9MDS7_9ZZZZ